MTVKGGPKIVSDGLVFNLDAAGAVSNKAYPINGLSVEYLIVAGGGGGGGVIGGGGGAGGLLNGFTTATIANGDYAIVVGAGGAGGTGWNTVGQGGNLGGDSSAFSITSTGGGGGVHHGSASTSTNRNGGSGGGGANPYSGQGGTGISGQGNNGGNNGTGNLGSGGGGAGSVGGNASGSYGGSGGLGKYYGYSFGRSVGYDGWFADGGAGGVRGYVGTFVRTATHGGGSGTSTTTTAGNGSTNTGSGGGGGGYNGSSSSRIGGNGGSGVVIIKYLGPQKAAGGDTIFNYEGYTVHVFTNSGTFTVGDAWGDLTKKNFKTKLINGPSLNRNIAKGVIYFDGTNQYMRPNVSHSYLESSTLSLFFKALSVNVKSNNANYKQATIIGYRHNGGYSDPTLGSLTLRSTNNGSSYYLHASLITTSQVYRSTSYTVPINQWMYAALVKDLENGLLKIYVNGLLVRTQTFDTTTYAQWTSAGNYIGANILDIGKSTNTTTSQGWGNDYFHGYMSNIRLYGRVLTDKQILRNFNALKGRFGL